MVKTLEAMLLFITIFMNQDVTETDIVKADIITNSSWTVTQYGNNYKAQLMCYTIEGDQSGLIIVDGGFYNDEEQLNVLEETINRHGNKVNAWILTHFDTDHAGAYMKIRERIQDLNVEKLFVQDTPDVETCKEKAKWYDGWDLYEKYLELDVPEKTFVHTGDEYEIIGLKFKVLSSYEEWIGQECNNLLNNGSIVFKLIGNEESILFCGDIQDAKIGEKILNDYKDELPSTYLQIPHHGNNNLSEEFYKIVNPKIVFFAAPKWLVENQNNVDWYTAPKWKQLFLDMGIKIYDFRDSPARIEMY